MQLHGGVVVRVSCSGGSYSGAALVVPLYAARVGDLKPGDVDHVECGACGHDEMIPALALTQGLRLGPDERITDLAPRLRCRECDVKGRAVVSRWGGRTP